METDFGNTEKVEGLAKADQDCEYIKLMKKSSVKGGDRYDWDLKLLTNDPNKIKELNDRMVELFGSTDDNSL